MSYLSSGSYVYCAGDPVNNVDPWGLGNEVTNQGTVHPGDPDFVGPMQRVVIDDEDEAKGAGEWWAWPTPLGFVRFTPQGPASPGVERQHVNRSNHHAHDTMD